jgi:hypothetical protein
VKVLVIPEDPILDQYILRPVVERIFSDLSKAPRVAILSRPRLRGVAEALNAAIIAKIVATYPMNDLFLVMVDRDGDETRSRIGAAREAEHQGRLFVCLAIEEVEIWMLAIHHGLLPSPWREIRTEVNVKERFAEPFLWKQVPELDPGEGRAWAMSSLGVQWRGVLQRCPEIAELRGRIEGWLAARS